LSGFFSKERGGSAVAGPLFFFCGGMVFLLGVLGKCGVLLWCFCGEFVVECVVNVVSFRSLLWWLGMGQGFEVYFGGGLRSGAG
jgi:hypothetical protein